MGVTRYSRLAGLFVAASMVGCDSTVDPTATSGASLVTTPSSPIASAAPSVSPTITPPSSAAPTGIVPGTVDRTSLELRASYQVAADITVATGRLDVTTTIKVENESGDGIDRLELNTIATRLGAIRLSDVTVDGSAIGAAIDDQTILVPLGGILPDGASTTVRIAYRARLRTGLLGSDWMFTRFGGELAMYRWIPWISAAVPFDRPNHGDPFVTSSASSVQLDIRTDTPMDLAAHGAPVHGDAEGRGRHWSFMVENVREVSLVLAPAFRVSRGTAEGVAIRVLARPGSTHRARLLDQARDALREHIGRLGVQYPWSTLTMVETEGGEGLETPGVVWIPGSKDAAHRSYLVYHEIAHQWFYGLVGSNQQREPFADEAAADLLGRYAQGTVRASRCPLQRLDRPITFYSSRCYYEVIYVQGGLLLDEIRQRIGNARFWGAIRGYLQAHRFGMGGTRELLEALRATSDANLLPLLRARFPSLY
jgi:aminopeptidase N